MGWPRLALVLYVIVTMYDGIWYILAQIYINVNATIIMRMRVIQL